MTEYEEDRAVSEIRAFKPSLTEEEALRIVALVLKAGTPSHEERVQELDADIASINKESGAT